jgi:hypothetical protein
VTNGTSLLYVKNTTINGGATGIYVNEDGGSTILEHVTITGATSYGIEVLNSPGYLTLNDSTIIGGIYGVDIQNSAYYGTAVFDTVLERTTITGANTAVYAGVGAMDIDASTIFNNTTAMQASGGSMKLSNNNIYNNTSGILCTSASSSVVSQGNNRHGSSTGYVASGGCGVLGAINLE